MGFYTTNKVNAITNARKEGEDIFPRKIKLKHSLHYRQQYFDAVTVVPAETTGWLIISRSLDSLPDDLVNKTVWQEVVDEVWLSSDSASGWTATSLIVPPIRTLSFSKLYLIWLMHSSVRSNDPDGDFNWSLSRGSLWTSTGPFSTQPAFIAAQLQFRFCTRSTIDAIRCPIRAVSSRNSSGLNVRGIGNNSTTLSVEDGHPQGQWTMLTETSLSVEKSHQLSTVNQLSSAEYELNDDSRTISVLQSVRQKPYDLGACYEEVMNMSKKIDVIFKFIVAQEQKENPAPVQNDHDMIVKKLLSVAHDETGFKMLIPTDKPEDSYQSSASDVDAMIRSALSAILSGAGCNAMHWRKTSNLTGLKNMSHALAVLKGEIFD
ncbi:hypothetical protein DAPPUDRAFT_106745 [Daphnia pulex]|uniref:Uncharacterized protein n=1 Tax=Daphnia pulex TaxID=6669 RepID=E9GUG7_DAPPU|nr:hypothetical protein DAPPUDRAFT_106745 [Daphnia pulex]|eukprot:EFX76849.1 hypothetical protein DAPPUDRAFT_106745 [Daphnia pulex]